MHKLLRLEFSLFYVSTYERKVCQIIIIIIMDQICYNNTLFDIL